MRNWARLGAVAGIMAAAAALAGCHHTTAHYGPTHFVASDPIAVSPRPRRHKARKSVVKRVAQPETVNAGARVRQFCGQRHIRFQRGQLQESASEKARNNELCRQEYRG